MRRNVKGSKGQTLLHIVLDREQIRLGVAGENWERGADNSYLRRASVQCAMSPLGRQSWYPPAL